MTEISNHPMRRFFRRKHAENSDAVSDEVPNDHETVMKSQHILTNSTALVVQQRQDGRSVFTMKVIRQWGSHWPVIQAVLFHYVSSVANDFLMQQWLQLN